ncbi:hypothetical protein C0J52_13450 [Blattella germanica]|nr:hypothetical protein C0J52_13450 [Blattella germanica]
MIGMYGTWTVKEQDINRLNIFERKVLRAIFVPIKKIKQPHISVRKHEFIKAQDEKNKCNVMTESWSDLLNCPQLK